MRETGGERVVRSVRDGARENTSGSKLKDRLDRVRASQLDGGAVSTNPAAAESLHSEGPQRAVECVENLTEQDTDEVRDYTGDGYAELNRSLRDPRFAAPELAAKAERLSSALRKLPAHEGAVFRGVDLDATAWEKYQPGVVVKEEAFTSTSRRKPFPGNTIFAIQSKTGRDVGSLAQYDEAEVLFDKGSEFLVLSHDVQDGQHRIGLGEA